MSKSPEIERIAKEVVDSAFTVHKTIGAGLLENAYEIFLLEELKDRGLNVQRQLPLSVQYKNKTVDVAYRLDLVVENEVLIELKSCDRLMPIHEAQILTYLRLSGYSLGFIINFGSQLIKDGIRRYAM